MRVLLIGSGGREHALAWAIAKSPLLEALFVAPGNGGTGEIATNVPLDIGDHQTIVGLARRERIDLGGHRAGCAGRSGPRRRRAGGGHQLLRAERGGGAARRQQGLHQGAVRRKGHSDGALSPLHRSSGGHRLCEGAWRPDCRQGGWAGGWQGRARCGKHAGSRGFHQGLLCGRVRRLGARRSSSRTISKARRHRSSRSATAKAS